jgi:hypothetical protein
LGLRKFSILLDTRAVEEQYQFEVSLFKARLPLLSPFVVSLQGQAPNRAPTGQNLLGSFSFPRAGPYLLFDVQVCTPKTPAVSGHVTQAPLATCEQEVRVFKKEIHHV